MPVVTKQRNIAASYASSAAPNRWREIRQLRRRIAGSGYNLRNWTPESQRRCSYGKKIVANIYSQFHWDLLLLLLRAVLERDAHGTNLLQKRRDQARDINACVRVTERLCGFMGIWSGCRRDARSERRETYRWRSVNKTEGIDIKWKIRFWTGRVEHVRTRFYSERTGRRINRCSETCSRLGPGIRLGSAVLRRMGEIRESVHKKVSGRRGHTTGERDEPGGHLPR